MCVVRQAEAIPWGVSYRMLQGQIINFIRKSRICKVNVKEGLGGPSLHGAHCTELASTWAALTHIFSEVTVSPIPKACQEVAGGQQPPEATD